jgi:hypothetical protein
MIGKLLTRLFTLFGFSLTCVACYGVMEADYNPEWGASGRVVDEDENPIPGIKVSLGDSEDITDSKGRFYLHSSESGTLIFTDVDGEENGGEFESRHINLRVGDDNVGDVVLDRKDD